MIVLLLINSTFLSHREKEKLLKPTNIKSVIIAIIPMTMSLFVRSYVKLCDVVFYAYLRSYSPRVTLSHI